jgi:hypothetical protein
MTVFIESSATLGYALWNPRRCSLVPLYLLPACEVLPLAFYPRPRLEDGLTPGGHAIIIGCKFVFDRFIDVVVG